MPRLRPTLRLRVAAGFALLGLAVSLALGGWLYLASRDLEQRLIDEALDAELMDYTARLARNPHSLPPETTTIRGFVLDAGAPADAAPESLRDLPEGRYTLDVDGVSYRVVVRERPDITLLMLHNRTQLARREQRFALLVVSGMTLATLLSAAGGWWLAGRVTAPVRELARRVSGRDPSDPVGVPDLGLAQDEVGELARTIDGYLRRLRAFVQRERAFVTNASHELRTPLAVIQGATDLLQEDDRLDTRTRERVARIARSARGMADLTTALLVLAREGQGQTSPPTPCDLEEVLLESVELHRPLLRHKPVELECRIEARPRLLTARPLVAVAVGNLLRNACTYTERGRVTATLGEHALVVEDTGPGIPPQEIECLFGNNVDCPRTVRGEGVGLPLVKRIADTQGWTVSVESQAGEGARFRLQFGTDLDEPLPPDADPP